MILFEHGLDCIQRYSHSLHVSILQFCPLIKTCGLGLHSALNKVVRADQQPVSQQPQPVMANDELDALDALEKEAKEYDKV